MSVNSMEHIPVLSKHALFFRIYYSFDWEISIWSNKHNISCTNVHDQPPQSGLRPKLLDQALILSEPEIFLLFYRNEEHLFPKMNYQ